MLLLLHQLTTHKIDAIVHRLPIKHSRFVAVDVAFRAVANGLALDHPNIILLINRSESTRNGCVAPFHCRHCFDPSTLRTAQQQIRKAKHEHVSVSSVSRTICIVRSRSCPKLLSQSQHLTTQGLIAFVSFRVPISLSLSLSHLCLQRAHNVVSRAAVEKVRRNERIDDGLFAGVDEQRLLLVDVARADSDVVCVRATVNGAVEVFVVIDDVQVCCARTKGKTSLSRFDWERNHT